MTDSFKEIREAYAGIAPNGPTNSSHDSPVSSKHSYGPHSAFNAGGNVNTFQLNSLTPGVVAISDEEEDVMTNMKSPLTKEQIVKIIDKYTEQVESDQVLFTLAKIKRDIINHI